MSLCSSLARPLVQSLCSSLVIDLGGGVGIPASAIQDSAGNVIQDSAGNVIKDSQA